MSGLNVGIRWWLPFLTQGNLSWTNPCLQRDASIGRVWDSYSVNPFVSGLTHHFGPGGHVCGSTLNFLLLRSFSLAIDVVAWLVDSAPGTSFDLADKLLCELLRRWTLSSAEKSFVLLIIRILIIVLFRWLHFFERTGWYPPQLAHLANKSLPLSWSWCVA